jgi:hypothetical protein
VQFSPSLEIHGFPVTRLTKIFIFTHDILFMARLNLNKLRLNAWFFAFVMFISIICIIPPVLAQGGTVSISYRGAGGYSIGDVITFDGTNTAGNTTLLKITGPGLPDAGVPVYNLDGAPGSGNTVPVNADGSWKFVWYSGNVVGKEKLITARYTFTASDSTDPEKKASTSILMKKPEFYVNQLKAAHPGDYVELSGSAEQSVTYVKIDIADSEGRILHTFISPVSATGSFNYGFRVDIQPGQYTVRVNNPSLENTLTSMFTVVPPETPVTALTTPPVTQTLAETVPVLTVTSPDQTQPSTSFASLTPSIPLSLFTPLAGLIISGLIALTWSNRYGNNKF